MSKILSVIGAKAAAGYVRTYCAPENLFAWPLYDEDSHPEVLDGADLTAPALLSYSVPLASLNQMGSDAESGSNPARKLFYALSRFVELPDVGDRFERLDRSIVSSLRTRSEGDPVEGPESWQRFVECLDAVQACEGLTSVAVTKILHRKRPLLVPLNDSRLRAFFDAGRPYSTLFEAIHDELNDPETFDLLESIAASYVTPAGRPMSALRALDIIVWSHVGATATTSSNDPTEE